MAAQADPFAPPSRLRLRLSAAALNLPVGRDGGPADRLAVEDALLRRVAGAARAPADASAAGPLAPVCWRLPQPGPQIRPRSAVDLDGAGRLTVRLGLAVPARHGRRLDGRLLARLLSTDLDALCASLLPSRSRDAAIEATSASVRLHRALQAALVPAGLVAFVADGAILPRAAGRSQMPLERPAAVPLHAPDALATVLRVDGVGRVRGLGLREGVTVLTGGGFHGKSTLLEAIARGIHPHVPGDGREAVVTRPDAVWATLDEGRAVTGLDVRMFVGRLPGGRDGRNLSTPAASGSLSQAAAVVEALVAGSRLILMDEDRSAANFLARDARMASLIAAADEPVTPYLSRARALFRDCGVSTVLVAGSAGSALEVADSVIQMAAFEPRDRAADARRVAAATPGNWLGADDSPVTVPARAPLPSGALRPLSAPRAVRADRRELRIGPDRVPLDGLPQLFEEAEVRGVALCLGVIARRIDPGRPVGWDALAEAVRVLADDPDWRGALGEPWDAVLPRPHEVLAALARWPGLGAGGRGGA